jgi:hypothetical protein
MSAFLEDIEVPLTIAFMTLAFLFFVFVWAKKGGIQDTLDQQALDADQDTHQPNKEDKP